MCVSKVFLNDRLFRRNVRRLPKFFTFIFDIFTESFKACILLNFLETLEARRSSELLINLTVRWWYNFEGIAVIQTRFWEQNNPFCSYNVGRGEGGGGGVTSISYGYIGMCRGTGYGFWGSEVLRYLFSPFLALFLVWSLQRAAKLYYLILECEKPRAVACCLPPWSVGNCRTQMIWIE